MLHSTAIAALLLLALSGFSAGVTLIQWEEYSCTVGPSDRCVEIPAGRCCVPGFEEFKGATGTGLTAEQLHTVFTKNDHEDCGDKVESRSKGLCIKRQSVLHGHNWHHIDPPKAKRQSKEPCVKVKADSLSKDQVHWFNVNYHVSEADTKALYAWMLNKHTTMADLPAHLLAHMIPLNASSVE